MNFAQLLEKLNIRIGDTDNFTFTNEEKTDALTEAFQDSHAVIGIWDDSLTYDSNEYRYQLPNSVSAVNDIYIRNDDAIDEPGKIDSNLWEVIDGYIHFKPGSKVIPTGYTIYIKGTGKCTISDTISDVKLQNYIMNVAQLRLFRMLGVKKSLKFLKNDTTLSEVIAMRRELQSEVEEYRRTLPRAWESA